MAENTYDPQDYTVEQVNDYLASETTTEEERQRVLQAERDGKGRKGILEAAEDSETEPTGLATTGNPNDLATTPKPQESAPAHQDGAPKDLAKVADAAEERGYLGVPKDNRVDYTQGNATVMNGGE